MQQLTEFSTRHDLDISLTESVSTLLEQAIKLKGKASIAVSGGSTPKGFFKLLSHCDIDWAKVTITLADERWLPMDSKDSNTRLVYENLLQNKASAATFFHLKQGDVLSDETLNELNVAVHATLLPFDVLILGMGEDGHTASLFPCSEQISQGLMNKSNALVRILPTTAPYQRISFSFSALSQSKNVFLHLCGEKKQQVLSQALQGKNIFIMPIRAFLHHNTVNTRIYWAP